MNLVLFQVPPLLLTDMSFDQLEDIYCRAWEAFRVSEYDDGVLTDFVQEVSVYINSTDLSGRVDVRTAQALDYCWFGVFGEYWLNGFENPQIDDTFNCPYEDGHFYPCPVVERGLLTFNMGEAL